MIRIDLSHGTAMHVQYTDSLIIDRVHYDKEKKKHIVASHNKPKPITVQERLLHIYKDREFYAYLKVEESIFKRKDWEEFITAQAQTTYPGMRKFTRSNFLITNPD